MGLHSRRSPMAAQEQKRTLTPEAFGRFLRWLSEDDELAVREYDRIRKKLTRFFIHKGCTDPDDLFDKTYAAEQKIGTILDIFAVLTIFVACLGLFGLATYTAEQRTKEIGIRKVLGASVAQVTQMLSAEFLKLVLVASLIAFPVSWLLMNKWLQTFAYRISISWWIFAVAGFTALSIALFTVIFQAIKAALANPVNSLRSE